MNSREKALVLAKHQLADVLPGGVACTCGAELAALNPPLDDEAVKGEPLALAVHQLQEMEMASDHQAAKIEAVREWIARADPHPELNGDMLRDLRAALSGDASPRTYCAECNRPLPHTAKEMRVCAIIQDDAAIRKEQSR